MPHVTMSRSVVAFSDCDQLGHMNVSRYFAACSDAVFLLQEEVGLGRAKNSGPRPLSFAVVHAESDFLAELQAGDAIEMQTGVVKVGGKSVTFHHRMIRAKDGAVVFESTFQAVMMNLETRRAVAVPDDIRAALGAFLVDPPA